MGNKNFYPITGKCIANQSLWLLALFAQPVVASPFYVARQDSLAFVHDTPANDNQTQTMPTLARTAQAPEAHLSLIDKANDPDLDDQKLSDISAANDDTVQAQTLPPKAQAVFQEPNTDQAWQSLAKFYHQNPDQCTGTWRPPASFLQDASVHDGTIKAQADYGYYNDKGAKLFGRAVLQQNQSTLWANTIYFDPNTQETQATQAVSFASKQGDDTLMGSASSLSFNTKTGAITAQDTAFASTKINAHGYADRLTHPSTHRYELSQAVFSTCPPNHRFWDIGAKTLELDTQKGRGIAKNATLNIKGVPVLYLPYFNFPIDNRRATGFLLPKVALGSQSKLQLSTPYYLNLAPNYDATITPTLFANKNPMLGVQLRYLSRFGSGVLDGAWLPHDRRYQNQTRHHLFFDHTWQPTPSTKVYATYRKVSDARYLSDFDTSIQSSPLNLPRSIGISHQQGNFVGDLRFESHQRLQGENRLGQPILDKDRPYEKLPALSLSYQKAWGGFLWSAQNDSTYFKKSIKDNSATENSGLRIYSYINASRGVALPWGTFSSKLGLTGLYTAYDKDSLDSQNLSRKDASQALLLPSLRLDGSLFFVKHGRWGNSFLTPRFAYFYTPYQNQENMPNFDSTLAHRSYRQLFGGSPILGNDRIADQNALSTALEYQYFDNSNQERLWAAIGKQWQFRPTRTRLDDQTPPKDTGIVWQMSAQATPNLWLEASGAMPTRTLPQDIEGSIRYQPYQNLFVRAGLSQRKNPYTGTRLSAYQASFALPIGNRWQVLGHTQYDKNFHDFVDSLLGIYYNDCCMGFAVYGRSYRNEILPNQKTHSIMAELKLKGLGSESRLSTLLKERLVGYEPLFAY